MRIGVSSCVLRVIVATGTGIQPIVEVAAAKSRRHRQQNGIQKPECAAALKQVSIKYLGSTSGMLQ